MHEASLMSGLMHRLSTIATAEEARRIVAVKIWIGALCHMSVAHFAEHFAEASAATLAEGARLDVTVSDDEQHARAQDILIESIEVET